MEDSLRALFLNEGALGAGVMGHVRAQGILRGQLAAHDVDARFVQLGEPRWADRALRRSVPVLRALDLDLQPVRWHLSQSLRARRAIARALEKGPADVLHVHSHTIALLAEPHMRRIPTLLSLDATVWQWQEMAVWRPLRPYSKAVVAPSLALERRVLETAAGVLAFSPWARRDVEARAPRAHAIVHHPGIDLSRFAPAPRRPRRRPRVLFVGGRFAEKGGTDLVAALDGLLGHELELDIVTPADVPGRDGLRVHRLDPSAPALLELYQQADVFCLPTHGDAVPFAVVEAMACGTPVVASDLGGIPDLLDGGRAGRLVPAGDRRALLEAIRGLAGDADAGAALAGAARERCERHYDAARQTARLVEIMREVAAP